MIDQEKFARQIAFILEIDKEKKILRQTHLSGSEERENDAEHAWHLALMTYLLSDYANEKIDVFRTVMMVLVHDLVEIDAGDTYAYDEEAKTTEKERERHAADRIFGILPDDQGKAFRALWDEFEAYETPEARFAHVMDNFQPMLLNRANDGKDWERHGVSRGQVEKRNEKTHTGSEEIWQYMKEIIEEYTEKGILKP